MDVSTNYKKLVGRFREVTESAGDTIDDQVHDDDEGLQDDFHLLKTKDPRSFVRLDELTLEDMVGVTGAIAIMSCVLSMHDKIGRIQANIAERTKKASERTELTLISLPVSPSSSTMSWRAVCNW